MSTACVIVIGNEILSGRTKDSNLAWLAIELNKIGVLLKEARVIPDIAEEIITAINACRQRYDYVFTTGGIGPTHDDITSENVAKAFDVPYSLHPEAEAILRKYYGAELNAARLKMAYTPEGASLIPNPVSFAPGFIMENVYVMAGVPRIMQAMFDFIRPALKGGEPVLSLTISVFLREGTIAADLGAIQSRFTEVEIGSYPFIRSERLGTSLVCRHSDRILLEKVKQEIMQMISHYKGELAEED